ncbi:hypothetical protein SK128_025050, partial [Halocaridina rubra]
LNFPGATGNYNGCLNLGLIAEDVIRPLLGQPMSSRLPATTSTRILLVIWLLFTLIIGTIYRSNLTAFLTIPKYPARPETLQSMISVGAM